MLKYRMDKSYSSTNEEQIYSLWEKSGAFTPKIDKNKKPFSIILPLPNANNPMHMGHALFTVQDILIRYHRMLGDPTLWLPGGDHAGIETQFVYEKELQKQGHSRFYFYSQNLYKPILDFFENRTLNQFQMKNWVILSTGVAIIIPLNLKFWTTSAPLSKITRRWTDLS